MAVFTNELKLDVGPMLKALTEAADKAETAGREIQDGLVKGIKAGSNEAKALSSAFAGVSATATKSVGELKNSLAAMIAAGKGSGDAFDELVAELKTADAEAKKLKNALQEVDKLTVDVDVKIDDEGATKSVNSIKSQLSEGLKGFGSSLTGGLIGGGVANAATAVLGTLKDLGAAAFQEYKALDTNIQNIGTLGVEASGLSLDRFRELATKLSTELPDSASNIANGVYNAISAGITGTEEDIANFVGIAGKVAVAGLSDTNTAVNALTSVVNAYGLGVKGAEQVSNTFFAAIKAGKTSFSELNAGLANVVPAASAAGIGFDEVAGTIAKLTTVGIPTAQATTQLRSAIVELQKPSKPLADALARIGLNAANMGAELAKPREQGGGLVNVLQRLEKSAADSGQSLTQIFGSAEAASAALALTGKNAESTNAILAGVNKDIAEGVAQKAFESAAQSIEVRFSILKNNLQAGFNTVFQAVIPVISQVISIFTDVLGPALQDAFSEFGQYFENLSAIVKPILIVIGGLIIANIINVIQTAAAVFKTVYGVINRVLVALFDAFKPVKDAILSVFGGDGALGEGFDVVAAFKDALKLFGEVLSSVSDIIIEVGGFVVELLVVPFQLVGGAIAFVITKFKEWFGTQQSSNKESEKGKGVIDRLREAFQNIRGTISGVTFAFQEVKKTIGDFFNALANFDLRKAIDSFAGLGERVGDAYNKGFQSVVDKDTAEVQAKAAEEAAKAAEEAAAKADKADKSDAKKNAAKASEDAIKKAQELFAIREAILKTEQETATTAILRQGLDKDAEKVALKKLELETQKKLTQEYIKAFGAVTQLDDATGQERVVSVGFKVDNKQLADINTRVQNFFQQEIRLQAELTLKPEELEKQVAKSLKFIDESLKANAKKLAEGVIDPLQFRTAVEGLEGTFDALAKSLQDAIATPEVQASPVLLAAYEEQILLINQKLAEFTASATESLDKANIEDAKRRIELNKTTLKSLETDEKANADEILRIRRELINQETNLKLAQLKSTGDLRNAETKIILAEAAKQREALDKTATKSGNAFDSVVGGFTKAIAGLDFTGAFDTLADAGTEAAEQTVDALKSGTISYQEAVNELADITVEQSSFLETVLQRVSDSFAKIRDASIASLRDISTGFDGSQKAIDELINATANAAAAGFAQILLEGENFGKGFVLLMLDILDATIPALVALILGQSLAANPLVGAVVSAALIATLKAAVAVARTAAQGFESGGYTGNVGTKDVAGVVHGQEFVINARATKQFRPMLEEMNKGRLPMIDNGEFSAMRAELSAIRRRLDGMPNGIQGSQAVRLDVGFDNYIYERDRRRAALRGLRG